MSLMRRFTAVFAALTLCAGVTACSTSGSDSGSGSGSGSALPGKGLKVFATTGYLADAAKQIAPGAKITTMVKPGGDPHTYQPTTQDIEAMQGADLVLWNGLHLEALMTDKLKAQGKRGLEVGAGVPKDKLLDWPEKDDKGNKLYDPHIWNSPEIWQNVVTQIGDRFAELDSSHAQAYKKNAKEFNGKIADIDAKAKKRFESIPQANRVLVTGHDAFNYLGKRYGLKVHATDFVSSEAELSASELQELVNTIVSAKVPAIFVDNLKNPQAVKSLREAVKAKGWDVRISDKELYADSLGEKAPVDTYLGVFQNNVDAITTELGAK